MSGIAVPVELAVDGVLLEKKSVARAVHGRITETEKGTQVGPT